MKITLTLAEVTALVIDRYSLPEGTVVSVDGESTTPQMENQKAAAFIRHNLRLEGCLTENGNIEVGQKIAAIKKLRTLIPGCGLAIAKAAIDDWPQFISYVEKHGIPADMSVNVRWS